MKNRFIFQGGLFMKNVLIGAVCVIGVVVGWKEAYKTGYNKGVKDCNEILKFGRELFGSVRHDREGA